MTQRPRRPKPGQDLATKCPLLCEEWDYERNGILKPEHVAMHSNKKVWWKCSKCGMSWQAYITNRTRGAGCPYDSGRYPIPGKTDLATLHPLLCEEWDYERNGVLKPEQFAAHSGKKVWWKCRNCGMHWEATILNRTRGAGCPYDSGRYPIPGKTDLATLHPLLCEEWDDDRNGMLRPEHVTAGSTRKVWWKCRNCGMHWEATISNRVRGKGCPYDSGRYPIPGKTDLATLHPLLCEEWDYERNGVLKPERVAMHSNKKVWWKCSKCGMSWQAVIDSRVQGAGCPYDSGRYPIPGKTDLATLHPLLCEEWDYECNGPLRPEHVTAGSERKVWWKCRNCGMHWEAIIHNRTRGWGCPYCSGKYPISGKTDLATLHPLLCEEWDYERNGPLRPEHVTAGSERKVWWKCKNCGMSWKAAIYSRVEGYGCPYDSGRYPIPGKTDLATLHPLIASEWHYERNRELKPEQFTAHSGKKVWWKCSKCGKSWQASIDTRTQGHCCPQCRGWH